MRWFVVVITLVALAGQAYPQTLQNPQFVAPYNYIDSNTTVANGWQPFRVSQNPRFQQSLSEEMPGAGGLSCQQIWADWSTFDAGVYQQISPVTVGRRYRITGWCLSIWGHGLSLPTYEDGKIMQRLGIDPYGGTNPASADVVWSWSDPLDRRWRELTVDAVAQSTTITLFARGANSVAQTNCLTFYDAFGFTWGTPVVISNLVVRPGSRDCILTWTTDVPSDTVVDLWQYRGTVKNATTYSDSALATQHSIVLTGLSSNSQYYFRIKSRAAGRLDGVSCGTSSNNPFTTTTGQPYGTLARALNNPDGTAVFVRDLIVPAGSTTFTNSFFVQQQDRTCGIRVDKGYLNVAHGKVIDISGTLATVNGERRLQGAWVYPVSTPGPPRALALSNADLGGGALNSYTPGVSGSTGPYNVGLFVRVWGRITAVDSTTGNKFFYIDDGSGLDDGTLAGRKGIRVSWLNLYAGVVPVVGKYAAVAGMSSCFQNGDRICPQVLLRSNSTFDFQQY